MYYVIINNQDELYHHQRLGAKWGKRNGPPYPLSRQQLSLGGYIQKRKEKKAAVAEKKKEDARKRAEEAKRKHEEDKERVLRSGKASEILQYQGELTKKEMQDAYDRIEWERKLKDISTKEIQTNMDKVDRIMKDVKTLTNWGGIAVDSYNLLASIYNATEEGKKNPWELVKKPQGGGGK